MSNLFKTTNRELEILQVLWSKGPSSVRQIHEIIDLEGLRGYTTTLKLMQIMYEKGLLLRDDSARTHIYFPAEKAEHVEAGILDELTNKLFAGSAEKLITRALSSKKIQPDELERIRAFINQGEKDQSKA